jgi:hypothetical protein
MVAIAHEIENLACIDVRFRFIYYVIFGIYVVTSKTEDSKIAFVLC